MGGRFSLGRASSEVKILQNVWYEGDGLQQIPDNNQAQAKSQMLGAFHQLPLPCLVQSNDVRNALLSVNESLQRNLMGLDVVVNTFHEAPGANADDYCAGEVENETDEIDDDHKKWGKVPPRAPELKPNRERNRGMGRISIFVQRRRRDIFVDSKSPRNQSLVEAT